MDWWLFVAGFLIGGLTGAVSVAAVAILSCPKGNADKALLRSMEE
jgi:gas vesicle protein